MTSLAVTIRNLKYRYRGQKRWALEDLSLEMEQGDFLVVMGPSEAGKSTLAVTLNGLIPHFFKGKFQGEVQVLGRNTREARVADFSEQVGIVFQDFEAQLFSTKVELEVAFGPENFCLPRDEIGRRIEENLRRVGLLELKNRPPSTLSGGQKQKLAIASVLAMRPQVLVMDEPTTDLDPISKGEVFRIAKELQRQGEVTLIVVEHDTEEIFHARDILLLQEGRVVRYGPAPEILREVDLLEKVGVMAPGVPKYFSRLGAPTLPLTPEEGAHQFQANGWRIREDAYNELLQKDSAPSPRYGNTLILCQGLEHRYSNGFKALRGIDLEIREGEMVAVVGQNGSGKTTLVKHFNGLLLPTQGQVTVNGKTTPQQGIFELGKIVGYVFQNPDHQIFADTVYAEVAFSLRLRKVSETETKRRVAEVLEVVGLAGLEGENPFSLTKSGRQRVAVASVLAARPRVLIFDEPTTGLDYAEQRRMMELVKRLNEQGHTVIFVTHHMWVVTEYAQRVLVLKDGQIFLQGSPRAVFSKERQLAEANLYPPHLVRLSNRLGKTMLSVEEMVACTLTA